MRLRSCFSFFFAAYAVSWSIAVPLALQAQGVLRERLPWSLHYLTAFGPAAAAFLIARLLREPAGVDRRAPSQSIARSVFWWTVGFGSPLLLFVIAQIAARFGGQTAPRWTSLGHHLGLKHFRMPPETLRIAINVFGDDQLRAVRSRCSFSSAITKSPTTRQRHWRGRAGSFLISKANWSRGPVTTCASASSESWTRASWIS